MSKQKKIKEPVFRKYPKKPKPGASRKAFENWLNRKDEIDRANKEKMTAYNNKLRDIDNEKKKTEVLRKRVAAVGATDYKNVKRTKKAAPRKKSAAKRTKKAAPRKKVAAKKSSKRKR